MSTLEHAILALTAKQHGAITRSQALDLGMSSPAVSRRVSSGEWVRVFQGVYRLAAARDTWEQTVMAGCLAAGPGAVASHRSAATLLGMPGVPRWVEVTVVRPRAVSVDGIIAHRARVLPPEDVGELNGIPATTPVRTLADLARIYPATRVGPMLDDALARRLVTRAQLEARATGRKHDDVLRELLAERPATAQALFYPGSPLLAGADYLPGGSAAYPPPLTLRGAATPPGPPVGWQPLSVFPSITADSVLGTY